MKKRILRHINKIMPNKVLRRQKFIKRRVDNQKHQRNFGQYAYNKEPRSSRFNRWHDYKRLNKSF